MKALGVKWTMRIRRLINPASILAFALDPNQIDSKYRGSLESLAAKLKLKSVVSVLCEYAKVLLPILNSSINDETLPRELQTIRTMYSKF